MALPNQASESVLNGPSPAGASTLVRDIERRLAPARPAPRRRSPLRPLVATLAVVWVLGMGGAMAGTMMASEGFRVDALQQQLTTAQREQQRLAGLVANATSSTALNQDAKKLGVPLSPLVAAMPRPAAPARRVSRDPLERILAAVGHYWGQLKRLESGGR